MSDKKNPDTIIINGEFAGSVSISNNISAGAVTFRFICARCKEEVKDGKLMDGKYYHPKCAVLDLIQENPGVFADPGSLDDLDKEI